MPVARAHHSSAVLNGVLYVAGGMKLDETQLETPITEIHSYHIESGAWSLAGLSTLPKQRATLLGLGNTLYELGGMSDGRFTNTMETYIVDATSDKLHRSCEHYVLPCRKDAGPLCAVLDEDGIIYMLWKHTGQAFSLSDDCRRFRKILSYQDNTAYCMAVHDNVYYAITKKHWQGVTKTEFDSFDMISSARSNTDLPSQDCMFYECVTTMM